MWQKRNIHQQKYPYAHKILVDHMFGNDAVECVDNLVGDKLALTMHYIRSCVPILYSSDEKAKCIHNSIND
jgi:hypothetical protein